jgi:opacity protein-like surface antigen
MRAMTDLVHGSLKRITPIVVALSFVLAPLAARAETLRLDNGSGAPPRSLIGSASLGPSLGRMSYSALLALDIPPSGFNVGPRISAEGMYGFMDLAPQLRLDLGGRVSFAYHSADTGGLFDGSLWTLDFVPDAKLRYAINDQLGVYGDFGLGLALLHASASQGGFSNSDTSLALAVQFGAGVAYAVTPNINLLGEIRFDVTTKSGAGLFVALPTVGLEFH